MIQERWLPVVGFEWLYEVSDWGRVRNKVHGNLLTGTITEKGYVVVGLRGRRRKVHRLVLEAFVGPCPEGMECRHEDGNPQNNHLSNIRWGTYSENNLDLVRHGRHNNARKPECKRGHEFTEENTLLPGMQGGPRKGRKCKQCYQLNQECLAMYGISLKQWEDRFK